MARIFQNVYVDPFGVATTPASIPTTHAVIYPPAFGSATTGAAPNGVATTGTAPTGVATVYGAYGIGVATTGAVTSVPRALNLPI